MLRVGIVAGEASGDILGAGLMASLKEKVPSVEFVGVGGDLMIEQGLQTLLPIETLSVMGIVDVIKQLPRLLAARKTVVQAMLAQRPDVFIGIDAPDFNLPIEKKLKDRGITTLHYVSPSVWAWRPKRIFKIKASVDDVLSILPFEVDFYRQYQAPCTFVGHPLADEVPLELEPKRARKILQLPLDKPLVAILPGSRGGEVKLLLNDFIEAAKIIRSKLPEVEFVMPFANEARKTQILDLLKDHEHGLTIHFFEGQSRLVMEAADSCILTSGTVALEAMLLKKPMVVGYKFSWLNYQLLKSFVRVKYFTLPNLLANKALVPELLQQQVTPQAIADITYKYLTEDNTELKQEFTKLHQQIRCHASSKAATRILELIQAD